MSTSISNFSLHLNENSFLKSYILYFSVAELEKWKRGQTRWKK